MLILIALIMCALVALILPGIDRRLGRLGTRVTGGGLLS
jgi:hypothetical protein